MRHTKLHLLLSLWWLTGSAVAAHATDLPLQITSDIVLTSASSPYYLVGNTTVIAGVTVQVQPGVQIIAHGDHELRIEGTFLADGTEGAPGSYNQKVCK